MFKRIISYAAVLALALCTFTSCGAISKVEDLLLTGKKEYRYEDTVYFPMEMVKTLNPAISTDEDTYYISKLIYQGLFRLDDKLIPQKELAQSYKYDDDGKTLTVSLRSGVKWHNGDEFTSADVKFSIETYKNLAKSGIGLYGDYVAGIKSVETDGDHGVIINFYKNTDNNIVNLIFPILPAGEYKNFSDFLKKGGSTDFIPVGTGPYKAESYDNISKLTLAANESYYGDIPKNTVVFNVLPDKNDAVNLLKAGEISLIYSSSADRQTLITDSDIEHIAYTANEFEFIGFNTAKKPLDDKRVRQAIAYAVDSSKLLEKAYNNAGIMSDSIIYPGYFGTENKGDAYPYDMQKAEVMLNRAGYTERDDDGYIENEDGEDIEISLLINGDNASRVLAASMVKTSLEKLGITVKTDTQSSSSYYAKLSSGSYDICIGGAKVNERYDLRTFLHSSYGNIASYGSAKADKYLNKIAGATDNEEKAELVAELKSEITTDLPYYCLFYRTNRIYYTEILQGELTPVYNDIYRGCGNLSCRYVKTDDDK